MNPFMNPLVRLTFKKHKAMSEARTALATAPLFLNSGVGVSNYYCSQRACALERGAGQPKGNPNPGVHIARLPDLPTPWMGGNHLQQERGGVHTGIRVVHTAEDVS